MATVPRYPTLYQVNTRVWLQRLSHEAGKRVTLADIDDATLDGFAKQGFDWIWLLSVWQIGAAGRAVSRSNPQWRAEFQAILPDLTEEDISGSGFAITAYTVSDALGGERALAQFRERLARRGVKLLLDFVPNHTAPDHLWVKTHPDYYVESGEEALAGAPQNYLRIETDRGPKILAYGRDPNFPGWPDTLQLNYANPELQAARVDELIAIAGKCDGVRCDMAMLLLPDIFQRTWGSRPSRSGRRRRQRCARNTLLSPSWPRSIGTSNGRCSSRVSATATTSGCTTACEIVMSGRSAITCSPASTTRTNSPASLKTTTSRGQRPSSLGRSTRQPQSSPISLQACASSIRVNSRGCERGYRPISAAPRSNQSTKTPLSFMPGCYKS